MAYTPFTVAGCDGDPYGEAIKRFVYTTFPHPQDPQSKSAQEQVFEILMGTGKTRLGPRPGVDAQARILQVVRKVMSDNEPLPLLVPWGSEKPASGQIVDVAELAGLKTLDALRQRVQRIYPPGLDVRIRVEDATAWHLFQYRYEQAKRDTRLYVESFRNLVIALDLLLFVQVVPESEMDGADQLYDEAGHITEHLYAYIKASDDYGYQSSSALEQLKYLSELGWHGTIPPEQRNHYRERYKKMGLPAGYEDELLARYLAESLARKRLGMLGDRPSWAGQYLQFTFVPPVPGVPEKQNEVRYRTLPENLSSNHLPPWRAKGYLRVYEDGTVRPALASWSDQPPMLHEATVTVTGSDENGGVEADVRMDYVVL